MPSVGLRPTSEVLQILEEYTDELMEHAARAAADLLDYKMSRDSEARQGKHWPENEYRSSALGQYPQEQTGDLRRSIEWERVASGEYRIGFVGEDPPGKAEYLEEVRQPLFMLFEGRDSEESMAAMNQAIEDAAGGGSR